MLLLAVFFVSLLSNVIHCDNTYLVTAPARLNRGQPFNVTVYILNSTYPVSVRADLINRWYNSTGYQWSEITASSQTGEFRMGRPGVLTLETPIDSHSRNFNLKLYGRGGIQFERQTSIQANVKFASAFIQTDKAMYKPGQTVKFRVIAIYSDMKPYEGTMDIEIKDPNNNIMKQWLSVQNEAGIVSDHFTLSDQPIEGDWSIHVKLTKGLDSNTVQQMFTVKQYKLPKFEVTVELPPFLVDSGQMMSGKVKAQYTYGKPVKGMVDLRVFVGRVRDSCDRENRYVQKAFPIDGEQSFDVTFDELRNLNSYLIDKKITVIAHVTESLTGSTLQGNSTIKVHRQPIKVEFLSATPSIFKPGLHYTAFVKVSQQDGSLLPSNRRGLDVYTCLEYERRESNQDKYDCHSFSGTYGLPVVSTPIPEDGIVPIVIEVPQNTTNLKMKAFYGDVYKTYTAQNARSDSNNFVQVTTAEQNLQPDDIAIFDVMSTEPMSQLVYEIKSRGSVLKADWMDAAGSDRISLPVQIIAAMAPQAQIVVYYVREDGEVVADSLSFSVEGIFENEVSVKYSEDKSEPNSEIELTVNADPQSLVNVLAVDQSVLLLKSGNDITQEKVMEEIRSYEKGAKPIPRYHGYMPYSSRDTSSVFNNAGMVVITDAKMSTRRIHYVDNSFKYRGSPEYAFDADFSGPPGLAGRGQGSRFQPNQAPTSAPAEPDLAEVERVRSVFPETFLWLDQVAGNDGRAVFKATVPDTLTSWVASAFAVHQLSGLGVAPTNPKLTVFRPFFVSLNLPISVIRGEQVVIQANVFNNLPQDVQVEVKLPRSKNYKNVVFDKDGVETVSAGEQIRRIMVRSGEPKAVYFPIIPSSLGNIDIEVSARSSQAADAVRRPLKVEPEGVKREFSVPILVDLSRTSKFSTKVNPNIPKRTVAGSPRVRLTVTGNLLGPSLDNLDALVNIPTGCGEQNIMTFAPDVFIADYLSGTGQLSPQMEKRIKTYLELGYQRQLSYQRRDKSFSAFGNNDEAGSTWLTAFVLKSFYEAKPYIFIHNNTINGALRWLQDRQLRDGSFTELGRVLDTHMQGRRSSGAALTAYVLITLLTLKDYGPDSYHREKLENKTRDALTYLEGMSGRIDDVYSLAVTSYALTLAGSPSAEMVFNKLKTKAVTKGKHRYWTTSSDKNQASNMNSRASSIDIVVTSYALLSYIARDEAGDSMDVVMWITAQRNSQGGFSSTRDTVLALEALSRFAKVAQPPNYRVSVKVKGRRFTITNDNALILQSRDWPKIPKKFDVSASGTGMALIQLSFFYNEPTGSEGSDFDVNTVLLDDNLDGFTLMTCAKHLKDGQTSMVVEKVQIPSGFSPDLDSIGKVAGVKRVERRANDVNIYFDEIGPTSTCVSMKYSRDNMVAKNRDSFVRVFDYYDTTKSTTVSYNPRKLKNASVCDVCEDCCSTN